MSINTMILTLLSFLVWTPHVIAARFDIQNYGAKADDDTDDTAAILKTLSACEEAGGGEVFVPAGVYLVSRQGTESPILEVPSNATLLGEGAASILKFDPRVNESNFWRMLGASSKDCDNVIYVWGTSRYNAEPGRDVVIFGNVLRVGGRGIFLNGVEHCHVSGNLFSPDDEKKNIVLKRAKDVRTDRLTRKSGRD